MPDIVKFQIKRDNSLLLLIDVQQGLMEVMKHDVRSEVERNVNLLVTSARVMNLPVVTTEQYPRGLGLTLESIRRNLDDLYRPVEKTTFSCCDEPAFQAAMRPFSGRSVLIAGAEAHICVLQTVVDLLANGYQVHLVADAVCSRHKFDWKTALKFCVQAGAVMTTTEIAIFQLIKEAGTPEFKALSPMIKNS